jgi:3-isopropylmalate dehydrogenase
VRKVEYTVTVIDGDGVGPEVVGEGVKVLQAVAEKFSHRFVFVRARMGASAFDAVGSALPDETLEACRQSDAVLFGAVGHPRYEQPNVSIRPERGYGIIRLRKTLSLFANIRPVRLYPSLVHSPQLKPDVVAGVDFIIVRELTGGIYFAEPKQITRAPEGRAAVDTLACTEQEIWRILRVGFRLAERRRKEVTSVDKFQILCSSDL